MRASSRSISGDTRRSPDLALAATFDSSVTSNLRSASANVEERSEVFRSLENG